MDNYFILLGLSFDPVEENIDKINEAINKKNLEWQKESKNPRKQVAAKEKLAKIPDIKKVMLDSSLRMEEAQKALLIKEEYRKDLKNELFVIQTKGYITPTELNEIYNKYIVLGYKDKEIKEMLTTSIEVAPISELANDAAILDNKIVSQLTTYFNNLSIANYSIYDYLNIEKNSDKKIVLEKVNKEIKKILEKGSKSNTDEVEQKLLGLCNTIFSEDKTIEGYNNFLAGCQYKKINELIKAGIKTNGTMTENLFQGLIKICIEDYSMTEKYAIAYIINNIKINKYDVDIDALKKINTNNKGNYQNQQFSKEEERELIRERILEEQKIKEQIEQEKKMAYEKKEKEKEEKQKFKNQYQDIVSKVFDNMQKQEDFLREKTTFMNEHTDKRIKNGLVPSNGMFYTLVALFIIGFIAGIYSWVNPQELELGDLAVVPLICVGVSCIVVLIYFYVNKMWQKCNEQRKECENLLDEFLEAKNVTIETSKSYEFFTEDARQNLISCETKNSEITQDFANKYNAYIKYNNKAKFSPWMSKLILVNFAADMLIILLQVFGDKL